MIAPAFYPRSWLWIPSSCTFKRKYFTIDLGGRNWTYRVTVGRLEVGLVCGWNPTGWTATFQGRQGGLSWNSKDDANKYYECMYNRVILTLLSDILVTLIWKKIYIYMIAPTLLNTQCFCFWTLQSQLPHHSCCTRTTHIFLEIHDHEWCSLVNFFNIKNSKRSPWRDQLPSAIIYQFLLLLSSCVN